MCVSGFCALCDVSMSSVVPCLDAVLVCLCRISFSGAASVCSLLCSVLCSVLYCALCCAMGYVLCYVLCAVLCIRCAGLCAGLCAMLCFVVMCCAVYSLWGGIHRIGAPGIRQGETQGAEHTAHSTQHTLYSIQHSSDQLTETQRTAHSTQKNTYKAAGPRQAVHANVYE